MTPKQRKCKHTSWDHAVLGSTCKQCGFNTLCYQEGMYDIKPKPKIKPKLTNVIFQNRWKRKYSRRESDWTIFGLSKKWVSCDAFFYKLCFFGFDAAFWFEKKQP